MTFLLLLVPATFAEDLDSAIYKSNSIALPKQSAYTGKGFSFGIGAGVYAPLADCDCMGNWQAQLEFFYKDWISGALDVLFLGGDLDEYAMVMYQRYRISAKFHKANSKTDFFIAPFLGLETTDISDFRRQVQGEKEQEKYWWWETPQDTLSQNNESECRKMFALDGFSFGLGIGVGHNLSNYIALTLGTQIEYNFASDFLLTSTPGVAFNVRQISTWAKNNLRSTWVSFELGSQKYFNKNSNKWALTILIGLELGV